MKSGADAAFVVCLFAVSPTLVGSEQMAAGPTLANVVPEELTEPSR
jgi:hypothetical protein